MDCKFYGCTGVEDSIYKLYVVLKPGNRFYENGKRYLKYYYGEGMLENIMKDYDGALWSFSDDWESVKMYFKNENGKWILKNMTTV